MPRSIDANGWCKGFALVGAGAAVRISLAKVASTINGISAKAQAATEYRTTDDARKVSRSAEI
jgi:hypothetical protein